MGSRIKEGGGGGGGRNEEGIKWEGIQLRRGDDSINYTTRLVWHFKLTVLDRYRHASHMIC